jgi:hypothetical protein
MKPAHFDAVPDRLGAHDPTQLLPAHDSMLPCSKLGDA